MTGRIFAIVVGFGILICLTPTWVSAQQPEKCLLPMAVGNCSESIQRWYYNNRTGLCQPFVYRGCNGNANNFNSTDYCYHACNTTTADGEVHTYSISDVSRRIKANRGSTQLAAIGANETADEETPAPSKPTGSAAGSNAADEPADEPKRLGSSSTSGRAPAAAGDAAPASTGSAPKPSSSSGSGIAPTSVPALIQNRSNSSGSPPRGQPPKPKQPSEAGAAAAPAGGAATGTATSAAEGTSSGTSTDSATPAAKPSRTKRSTSSKRRHRRVDDEKDEEDVEEEEETKVDSKSEHEEEETSKKSSAKSRSKQSKHKKEADEDVDEEETSKKSKKTSKKDETKETVEDLVERMKKTASKLEKLANKKSKKASAADEEEHEDSVSEGKNEENQTKEEKPEKSEHKSEKQTSSSGTRRRVVRRRGRVAAKSLSSRRSGRRSTERTSMRRRSSRRELPAGARSKLLDITMVGGARSAVGEKAVKTVKQSSSLSSILKLGMEEGRKLAQRELEDMDDDDDDDDDIEIVGERIRTIILDPTYVFSYSNISADDMISLQEMAAQSEIATMQLMEKMADEIKNKTVKKDVAAGDAIAAAAAAASKSTEANPAKVEAPIQVVSEPEKQTHESQLKETKLQSSASVVDAVKEEEKSDSKPEPSVVESASAE